MSTKFLTALFALFFIAGVAAASPQTVFATGGGTFHRSGDEARALGSRASTQIGVRLWYTDLLRLRGAITFQGLNALEGGVEVHPFNRKTRDFSFGPYVFAGFGRYFAGARDEQAVVPAGVGLEYPVGRRLNLNLELAGRWTLAQPPGEDVSIVPALAPSVGLSFDLGWWGDRPASGQPAIFAAREKNDAGDERAVRAPEETRESTPLTDSTEEETATDESRSQPSQPRRDMIAKEAPLPEESRPRAGGPARRAPARGDTTEDTRRRNKMRDVPAGTFVMGLTDEDPLDLQQAGRKRISVTPFAMEQYEVSNADYRAFLNEVSSGRREEMRPDSAIWKEARSRSTWGRYFRGSDYANYPVVGVTHEQAQEYCAFYDKRLPTEAEWEYAARGDLIGSIYPWQGYEPRNNQGRYLANYNPDRGGYAADGYAFTAPGDAYPPSSWGLHHMSGNVAEWVQDAYHPSYSELSDFNPLYEAENQDRYVVRGGSWASNAFYIGVGVRDSQPQNAASPYIGFRCAGDSRDRN